MLTRYLCFIYKMYPYYQSKSYLVRFACKAPLPSPLWSRLESTFSR